MRRKDLEGKKLAVKRETLRQLSEQDLGNVAGGGPGKDADKTGARRTARCASMTNE